MISTFSSRAKGRQGAGDMARDAIPDFIAAMENAGVRPAEPIADLLGGGDLIRFAIEGDGPGKRNGWAVLHTDGLPAGAFGSWKLQISEKWRAGSSVRLSAAERRERRMLWQAQKAQKRAARLTEQTAAAGRCQGRWERAGPVDPAHPYLVKKRISGEGLRQTGPRLLVPMFNPDGQLWNIQTIDHDGVKRFAKGGRQEGLFCVIGRPDAVVMIGEGFATCAAARRATGHSAVVAFSAKNLAAAALAMQAAYPDCDLVVLADDDTHLIDHPTIKQNVGLEAAHAAAFAVGGRVALPPRENDNG